MLLAILPVLHCLDIRAQGNEVMMLRRRNAILQEQVDSLRRRLAEVTLASDPWSELSGLDERVSSFRPDGGRSELVELASPSVKAQWRPSVDLAIERYIGKHMRMMESALYRYARWFGYFRSVFSEYGVPEELTVLSIVESAVSPEAVSKAGAAGVWQLMPSTARQYGLEVDGDRDERTDVARSTVAAARLLSDLHRDLGSWSLSLLAYNCGAERVRRAQIRAGGTSDPWKVLPFLPAETQAYLPSFLAVSYLSVYGESKEGLVAQQ